jgi:hypothetical protein
VSGAMEEDNLLKMAAYFCEDIKALPEWQRIIFEGEIRRLKEAERISRENGMNNCSRLIRI